MRTGAEVKHNIARLIKRHENKCYRKIRKQKDYGGIDPVFNPEFNYTYRLLDTVIENLKADNQLLTK